MAQNPKWDLIPSDKIIVRKEKKKLFHNLRNDGILSESTGTIEVIIVITPGAKMS